MKILSIARAVVLLVVFGTAPSQAESVARLWNKQNVAAIRMDVPHPPVHARNLLHTSVAMWDAWAAYDGTAVGYVLREDASSDDIAAARREAISYAAYGVLKRRYAKSVNGATTVLAIRAQMEELGYDPDIEELVGDSPAAVGNRCAAIILSFADSDGSNESNDYQDFTYAPVNEPLILVFQDLALIDPNRWQPLAFDVAFTQNGLIADEVQTFLGSHWGDTRPFAMSRESEDAVYFDPGTPPQLGSESDAEYKAGNLEVIRASSRVDPAKTGLIDISPRSRGNSTLGTNDGTGYELNPVTGQPYEPNLVAEGDYGRVLAEFWADGPDSETPPGHWNTLANTVADHPEFERKIMGEGEPIDALEWDVKLYFALNAATHDAAVSAWGCKRKYDYIRPISSIRYLAKNGQSSDPDLPSYSPDGIPLIDGMIELVTEATSQAGERHAGLAPGSIALFAWGGEPLDPETEFTGTKWIDAANWLPYQRDTFVTPAFAGYVSGHSAFSRAAAEVLTSMTGSKYFPAGMGTFTAHQNEFLEIEQGPSVDVQLQWATYYDAADEAGLSRIYGGIHVPADDGPGRKMGSQCGIAAWEMATRYFDGSILNHPLSIDIAQSPASDRVNVRWSSARGLTYSIEETSDMENFNPVRTGIRAGDIETAFDIPIDRSENYFRVRRE
jgi:hypothetical protein